MDAIPCQVCGTSFVPTRSDARMCSARCRKRKQRGTVYVLTPEDRAAIARVKVLVPCPVPVPTEDQIRAHIEANAVRT